MSVALSTIFDYKNIMTYYSDLWYRYISTSSRKKLSNKMCKKDIALIWLSKLSLSFRIPLLLYELMNRCQHNSFKPFNFPKLIKILEWSFNKYFNTN